MFDELSNEIDVIFENEITEMEGALVPDYENIERLKRVRDAILAKLAEYAPPTDDREAIQPGDYRYYQPQF